MPLSLCAVLFCFFATVDSQRIHFPEVPTAGQATGQITLSEALAILAQRSGKTILSDAYLEAGTVQREDFENKGFEDALRLIAAKYQREIVPYNSVVLLRSRNWARYQQTDWTSTPLLGPNKIDVVSLAAQTEADRSLPVQRLQITASNATADALLKRISEVANIRISVDESVRKRMVHFFGAEVDTITALGALAYLLNAGPEVTLRPSAQQIAYEDERKVPEKLRERMAASNKLRSELEKLLSKDQRAALDGGKPVALQIGSLPPDLQRQAVQYIKTAFESLSDGLVPSPDLSRGKEFSLRFLPSTAGDYYRMLGAVTVAADGSEFYF